MKKAIGFAILSVALSATTMGCGGKNKQRAERLEAELARCEAAVQRLQSGQLDAEQKAQYASLDCARHIEQGGAL